MNEPHTLSLESLIEIIAEKLADKLARDPNRLCPRLLTIEQAAAYLGRSREAIQHLASSGKIPTVRSDRRVFLDRLDLDKWIDDNKTGWV
jgi:excisionase family DNA binding protein